jgi:Secretion system C-terminal sorting domain
MKKVYLFSFLIVSLYHSSWAQCPATITISGIYSTLYTGSNSWIASSGYTAIPTGADVTLDANPLTDGYVLLDTGFETQPNAVFLAVVITPCSLLGLNNNELDASLSTYPNPVYSILNIDAKTTIKKLEIIDSNGRVILSQLANNKNTNVNLESISSGIYLLKVNTNEGTSTQKIIKN